MNTVTIEHASPKLQLFLEADPLAAEITKLGWDTECTGRSSINILKFPATITFFHGIDELSCKVRNESSFPSKIAFNFILANNKRLAWDVSMQGDVLRMLLSCLEDLSGDVTHAELVFPFEPRNSVISILANHWTGNGTFHAPFIVSAPDLGQMLVTCTAGAPLAGTIEGNRKQAWLTTTLQIPLPSPGSPVVVDFSPLALQVPDGFDSERQWKMARRGWFNQLQFSCGASGGSQDVIGVWANNTLSDPVSSLLYMLGDATLLVPELAPGISMAPLLRRALDYWVDSRTGPDGLVAYTARGKDQHVMDGNPALLIGAWCHVKSTRDLGWLERRIHVLERVSSYMETRDVDGDGIIESMQDGRSGEKPPLGPDCAWDCYVSGHKNAYVNALAFRAWNCLGDLELQLGREDKALHYQGLARRLKASFLDAFYNEETGWLAFWRSDDGKLHDISNDSPTSLAISYGLIDRIVGAKMIKRYWAALEKTGFSRFDLGNPLNFSPVPPSEMLVHFTFQQFLNGGCCVSNAAWFLDALHLVGMIEQRDMIIEAMLERQDKGVFSNGGGFQNGFVDTMGMGAEVFDWDGNPAGYEGHLVYCWAFLQSLLLHVPSFREKIYSPIG